MMKFAGGGAANFMLKFHDERGGEGSYMLAIRDRRILARSEEFWSVGLVPT